MTTMLKSTKYFQTSQPSMYCHVFVLCHVHCTLQILKLCKEDIIGHMLSAYFLSCHHFYQERNNPLSLSLSLYKLSFFSGPWQPMMTSFLHVPWHCLRLLRLHCSPRPRLGVIASLSPPLRYWVTGDNYLLQSISTISTQYLHAESFEHSPVQWISM